LTDVTTGSYTTADKLGTKPTGDFVSTTQGETTSAESDTTTIKQTTTEASSTSTTPLICTETDYIETLISTNSIRIRPNDASDKQDLITKGLDLTDEQPSFKIDLPEGGLIVRDVKISSLNIIKVEIVFITESGTDTKTIQGMPTSLPTNEFPIERIGEILIKVLETTSSESPKQVKLSVIACAETSTTTSVRKCWRYFLFHDF
jgi:hypothetical protein